MPSVSHSCSQSRSQGGSVQSSVTGSVLPSTESGALGAGGGSDESSLRLSHTSEPTRSNALPRGARNAARPCSLAPGGAPGAGGVCDKGHDYDAAGGRTPNICEWDGAAFRVRARELRGRPCQLAPGGGPRARGQSGYDADAFAAESCELVASQIP